MQGDLPQLALEFFGLRYSMLHVSGEHMKELKPRFADVAQNAEALRAIAEASGQPVFGVALDMSKWYHQLFYHAAELWKMGAIMPGRAEGGGASDVMYAFTEHVMAMGMTPSSEIAQRFANNLIQALCHRMDAVEGFEL